MSLEALLFRSLTRRPDGDGGILPGQEVVGPQGIMKEAFAELIRFFFRGGRVPTAWRPCTIHAM